MDYLNLHAIDTAAKTVVLRTDLNVPICDGLITDDTRITAALPTIKNILASGAALIILSHLGRPTEGEFSEQFSLKIVADKLSELLGTNVRLAADPYNKPEIAAGEIVMLENVRFNIGEKDNSDKLARAYAALGDVFVMDAFATAHRKHASTYGAIIHAPIACAGELLDHEIKSINAAINGAQKPIVAIVGGAKVSTKLSTLNSLLRLSDVVITGGGIANTLLKASGINVGSSLVEDDQVDVAKNIIEYAANNNTALPLPVDCITANEFSEQASATQCEINNIADTAMILDAGPATITAYKKYIATAGTIIWNGPLGVFEWATFSNGTKAIASAIAESNAYSLAGGGDTLAAINKFNINGIDFCSTGGGAFLEYLETNSLPAIQALKQHAKDLK
jgi:phosphoglycerate kinase